MKRAPEALRDAFSYFSIVPVAGTRRLAAPGAQTLAALPLVGAVLGGLAGGCALLVARIAPRPFVLATAFTLPLVLSGAIHVDGFLDCSDAVFASVPPERRLEILKDPAHGTYALTAFGLLCVWSLAALGRVPSRRLPGTLAYAGALARFAAVLNARVLPYGRAGAPTRFFEARPSAPVLALEALLLCAASFGFSRRTWLLVPLTCLVARAAGAALARRLGGGLVGDCYGFLIVALEPAIVAFANRAAERGQT